MIRVNFRQTKSPRLVSRGLFCLPLDYGVGTENTSATDCVSWLGGITALTSTVKVAVHWLTAPSVSVIVQDLVPVTGPFVEGATAVNIAVFVPLTTAVAEGSENATVKLLTTPPEGVKPSARKGVTVSVDV